MKKVTFLLPRTGEVPIGGFKIVYEYGNRLAQRNVQVTFVYGIVSRKDLSFLLSYNSHRQSHVNRSTDLDVTAK